MAASFDLADLIDLELQFTKDAHQTVAELSQRDRQIGLQLNSELERRKVKSRDRAIGRVRLWLSRVQEGQQRFGQLLVGYLQKLRLVAFALSLLAGGSTAAALLSYDGSVPVNILWFLGFFVFGQLAFLAASTALAFFYRMVARSEGWSFVAAKIRDHVYRHVEQRTESADQRYAKEALTNPQRLQKCAERWAIFEILQGCGTMFNFAAAVTLLALVATTDMAFAWSTTIGWIERHFPQIVATLAAPWELLGLTLTPSADLIRHTEYLRLESRYATGSLSGRVAPGTQVGAWWTFLLGCQIFYGLLPRCGLWAFGIWRSHAVCRQVRLDRGPLLHLVQRLTEPALTWEGEAEQQEDRERCDRTPSGAEKPMSAGGPLMCGRAVVIRWHHIPVDMETLADHLQRRYNLTILSSCASSGRSSEEASVSRAVAEAMAQKAPLVIVADVFDLPGRGMIDLTTKILSDAPEARIFLLPLDLEGEGSMEPSADEIELWRRQLLHMNRRSVDLLNLHGKLHP